MSKQEAFKLLYGDSARFMCPKLFAHLLRVVNA